MNHMQNINKPHGRNLYYHYNLIAQTITYVTSNQWKDIRLVHPQIKLTCPSKHCINIAQWKNNRYNRIKKTHENVMKYFSQPLKSEISSENDPKPFFVIVNSLLLRIFHDELAARGLFEGDCFCLQFLLWATPIG